MKLLLIVVPSLFLTACSYSGSDILSDDPLGLGQVASSAASESSKHELSPTSEVRSINEERNEYINHALGFSILFPKLVLEQSPFMTDGENPTVPIKVIENGEIITFSRGYTFDISRLDNSGNSLRIDEDLSMRHPYFSSEYLDDPIYPRYPYQIYAAKADSIEDVRAFMKRVYGDGCTVNSKDEGSTYENRPGVITFSIGPDVKNCPGFYPIGDIVTWYQNQHVVTGIQPGWSGNFGKPYLVKTSVTSAESTDYTMDIIVHDKP